MSYVLDLQTVIADAESEANILKGNGAAFSVARVERLIADVKGATEDYRRRLNLADARLKSGLSERTLRRRHRELAECGMAGYDEGRQMWFRACVVPQKPAVVLQRDRGRRAVA